MVGCPDLQSVANARATAGPKCGRSVSESRIKYVAELSSGGKSWFRKMVLTWYAAHGRDLPWRRVRDPYAILVSEIMLHQTQVATVVPVYEEFMRRFPTVESLAAADLEAVKALTDALGYKIRGTWLHQIARTVSEELQGVFPDSVEALSRLPGIGRYTAGAIMSFAFERRAPIVDTNVNRFIGRYFGLDYRDHHAETRHRLWALAEAMVPEDEVHAFNQALMDIGALVCTSRKPACLICPVYSGCVSGGPSAAHSRAAEFSVDYRVRDGAEHIP